MKMKSFSTIARCAFIALAATLSVPALAVDGVVLIDQSKALAGNVTPGDTAGFPIVVSQPGSYRLTSNLAVPNADTTAIEISSDRVTIDLNGFSIIGPVTCVTGFQCSGGEGDGVHVALGKTFRNITVQNGTISGMGCDGIRLFGTGNVVDRMRLDNNGLDGLDVVGGEVTNSHASQNGRGGFIVSSGIVTHNTAEANSGNGFTTVHSALVTYNLAKGNGTANSSGGGPPPIGFALSAQTGCVGNVAENNASGCPIPLGPNVCDGHSC